MVELVLALAAIAVTAAIVIGDARPPGRQKQPQPEEILFEEAAPIPTPLEIEDIDAPTQTFDVAALAASARPATTFALPLPNAPILPPAEPVVGSPHPKPDPDRLIQTEVLVPVGSGEEARALMRLVIGIAVAGLALGLVAMGLGRAVGLFIHAL